MAIEAALAVREPLLAAFRSAMAIDYKVDLHDLVTRHDRESEAAIRDFILARVPDSTVVGEEDGESGAGRIAWYVDPIDGTSNFARGLGFLVRLGRRGLGRRRSSPGRSSIRSGGNVFSADLGGAWLERRADRSRGVADERPRC